MTNKTFVFLDGKPFSGISQKTGNPFTIRSLKFADPNTFENHQLPFDETLDTQLPALKKGDRFTFETQLNAPRFGNGNSEVLVTAIKKLS